MDEIFHEAYHKDYGLHVDIEKCPKKDEITQNLDVNYSTNINT